MLLLALAVVLGAVAGWLRPPLGTYAARPRFMWIPLLGAGAALNLAAYLLDGAAATAALVASLGLLLGFTVGNRTLTGVAVIGVGLACNLVAVGVNGGMPVRGEALVAAGVVEVAELDTLAFAGPRHLERSDDVLPVLGDVLPLPLPVAPEVLSFGDLIVVLGAADALRDLARRRHRRTQPARAGASVVTATAGPAVEPAAPTRAVGLAFATGEAPVTGTRPPPPGDPTLAPLPATGAHPLAQVPGRDPGCQPGRGRRFTGSEEASRPLAAPTRAR